MSVLGASRVGVVRLNRRREALRARRAKQMLIYVLLFAGLALFLTPFYWLLRTSLMWEGDVFWYPPKLVPNPPMWRNYITIFQNSYIPMGSFWKNSVKLAVLASVGDVVSASLIGYSVTRIPWRGRNIVLASVFVTMFLPFEVTIIPTFLLWKYLGLLDSLAPLIITSWTGHALYVFLMRQFIMTIPRELDDAAKIDGCGTFGIYRHIILPLSKPVLAAIGIFAFQRKWNEFFQPLIYISTKQKLPLAVGLHFFRNVVAGSGDAEIAWSHLMAATTLSMVPILIIFFFAQRLFIQGIVVSGIKG